MELGVVCYGVVITDTTDAMSTAPLTLSKTGEEQVSGKRESCAR